MMLNLNVSIWHQVNFSIFDNLNILQSRSQSMPNITREQAYSGNEIEYSPVSVAKSRRRRLARQ